MLTEERLFARHAGKALLLDSNLLLVFLAGACGATLFNQFKRVSSFTMKDYDLLLRVLAAFTVLLTTPHILTEVSNLANSLSPRFKALFFQNFASLIASETATPGLREHWQPAVELAQTLQFVAFAITDSGLAQLSSEALIVTDDYRLSGALKTRGIAVFNFNDLRKLERNF